MHRQIILVVSMLQHWPRYLDPTRGRNWINWFSSTSYYAGSPRTSSRTGFYNVYIQSDERGNRNTLWGGRVCVSWWLNIRVNRYKILSINNIHFVHTSHIIKEINFYMVDDQGRIQMFSFWNLKMLNFKIQQFHQFSIITCFVRGKTFLCFIQFLPSPRLYPVYAP